MNTRELIEAVKEPRRFMAPGPWITRDLKECVLASDDDALRAATVAVLDELGNSGAFDGHSGNQGLANDDCPICKAVDNARALREKLK